MKKIVKKIKHKTFQGLWLWLLFEICNHVTKTEGLESKLIAQTLSNKRK